MQLIFVNRKTWAALANAHGYVALLLKLRITGKIQLHGLQNKRGPNGKKKSNIMVNGLDLIRCTQKTALFCLSLVQLNPFCNSVGKFIPIAGGKLRQVH